MNDESAILMAIQQLIDARIKEREKNTVRREPAIVLSADNELNTAVVRLLSSGDDSAQNMNIQNVSGMPLAIGEIVQVDLWGYPTFNAVIAFGQTFSAE